MAIGVTRSNLLFATAFDRPSNRVQHSPLLDRLFWTLAGVAAFAACSRELVEHADDLVLALDRVLDRRLAVYLDFPRRPRVRGPHSRHPNCPLGADNFEPGPVRERESAVEPR